MYGITSLPVYIQTSGGGTTTPLTLTADVTVAASILKLVGLIKAPSATDSAVLINGVGLNEKTTTVGVAGNVLSAAKLFGVSAVVTATMTLSKVFMVAVSAAVTVIASKTLQAGKNVTASASGAVQIVKSAGLAINTVVVGVAGKVFSVSLTLIAAAAAIATVTVTFIPFAPVVAAVGRLVGLIRGAGKVGKP